ncbi:MATE family efflux transporter [Aliiglaciecola lipolytica]|uniref:MATE family efflux transporter n=1 Tax=Aliiglaciecola lipolytica TaxID=477689 RepID=UPI001C0854B6|nr:MATE family efflux transporter [Aliiglaciecola lipolytica]MBU2880315.1 hypothetical protein [Aliiglaciecola lipolytica]
MTVLNRVAKNTGFLYLRMAITIFISLYSTRLILAALGVEDFGIYSLVGGLIALLGFLNSSMAAATQRFMSFAQGAGEIENVKRIFNMSTILHFGMAILVVIVLEILGVFLFNGFLNISEDRLNVAESVYQFMIISTFFTVISVPYEAVITSHENMLFYAILGIIESIFKLGIAIYITYGALSLPTGLSLNEGAITIVYTSYDSLFVYGFCMAALSIFLLLVNRVYCHLKYTECAFNFKLYYDKVLFKDMCSFAGWSFFGSSAGIITNYGQGILLNVFFGTKANAGQGIANQVSGQLEAFSANMMKALNPVLVKSEGANDRENMLRIALSGSKLSFVIFAIFAVPFILEIEYLLDLWLVEVPDYAIPFAALLLSRRLIAQLFGSLTTCVLATGQIKSFQLSTSLIEFLPLIISSFLFIKGFDPYWLYVVLIVTVIIRCFGITLYFSEKKCGLKISYFIKEVIIPSTFCVTLSTFLSFVPLLIMDTSLIRLLVVTVVFVFSFLIISYFLLLNRKEKNSLLNLVGIIKLKALKV